MRKKIHLLIAVVVLIVIAACTSGSDPAPSETTAPDQPAETAAPDQPTSTTTDPNAVPPSGGAGTLTILNTTDADICSIAALVDGGPDWNENILDATLVPGETWVLTDMPPMVADLRALDCSGEVVDVAYGTRPEDGPVWAIAAVDVGVTRPPPQATTEGQEWLVMLYLDADDELIEGPIVFDVDEAELAGSSDRVQVVAQVDRFEGGFAGYGDWSTTKRFVVSPDGELGAIRSEEVVDLGEANMADPATLADFATWAIDSFPADKHVLILSDHGSGWPGGWTDQSAVGDVLTVPEIAAALDQVRANTSLEQLELIGFDACLMASLEVFAAMAPHARYAVASEEVEPAYGWAYGSFLADLVGDPDMHGGDLAESIVGHYIDSDPGVAELTAEQAESLRSTITLSAVDLAMMPDLLSSLDDLATAAASAEQDAAAVARFYAQSYTSVFPVRGVPQPFLDLGHFARMLADETRSDDVFLASQRLIGVVEQAVIAEKHGEGRPGSTGITLYFPNSLLYGLAGVGSDSRTYASQAEHFAGESLWDDFMVAHYTGAPMPATGQVASVAANAIITGPGVGDIEIGPVDASSDVFSATDPVFLETRITGDHVAQIYLFQGIYDDATASLRLLVFRYVESDVAREIAGVWYPDWAAETVEGALGIGGPIAAEDWAIYDGTNAALALCLPEQYGPTCIAYGYHVSAATGETRYAFTRWINDSPEMLDLFVFSDVGGSLAPFRHTAEPGDQFIPEAAFMDTDTLEWSFAPGDRALTFGAEPLLSFAPPSEPGNYAVGVIVVDMDGNQYPRHIDLTVAAGS